MAKSVLSWAPRRALSENLKASPEDLSRAGRELLEAHLLVDAANFMAKAGDQDGLSIIQAIAIEEGNFFLYQMVKKLQQIAPSVEELNNLAARAQALGLVAYETSAQKLLTEMNSKPRR